jgi:flap endonuclease-1
MGIKNLYKCILSHNLERNINISKLKNKIIAIDISILLYQVVISTRSKCGVDHLSPTGNMSTHVLGLFNKTIILLKKHIFPVYVFDGKPHELKRKTLDMRKDIKKKALKKLKTTTNEKERIKYLKRSVSISKKHLDDCRELLDYLGIPYINAPEEADSQCAYMAYTGLVDGVLTEDMDIFTFGSPIIYKNLYSSKKKEKIIVLKELLYNVDLKFDEFIEWCCLLGSDYSKGIIDLNFEEILKLYKNKDKDILSVIKHCKINNIRCDTLDKYINVKKYFKNPTIIEVTNKDLILKTCDVNLLINFMVNKFGFNKSKLLKKISYLKYRNKCIKNL